MAQAIYGRTGEVAGWLDGDDIRDMDGRARAFVHRGTLVDYGGLGVMGSFEDGILRDTDGAVVAVLAGATGIVRPTLSSAPESPSFEPRPARPSPPLRPGRSSYRPEWSRHTLEELLAQSRPARSRRQDRRPARAAPGQGPPGSGRRAS
jgi:hypothetical protein